MLGGLVTSKIWAGRLNSPLGSAKRGETGWVRQRRDEQSCQAPARRSQVRSTGWPLPAWAQAVTPLKVELFPGLSNLSIYAAQSQGLFAKYQLAVELAYTPNSQAQRDGLAKGKTQIIHTAADNAVAMVELAKQDAIIVAGGDNGFNRILAQPDIKTLADLQHARGPRSYTAVGCCSTKPCRKRD